jgi:DNA-binding MarR family transcriptional regulator
VRENQGSKDATRVVEALRRLVRALRASAGVVERATGLSGAQLFVLRSLAASPAASLQELAARVLTDPSSASVVVARLVEQGLVERRGDPRDRRRVELSLTAAGRTRLRRAPATAQERLVATVRALPADTRAELAWTLDSIVRSIGADEAPAAMFFEPDGRAVRRRRAR